MAFGAVTPLGMLLLLYGPQSLSMINLLMFTIGFTYNARSTGAYIYNNEFIETDKRINIERWKRSLSIYYSKCYFYC